MKQLMFLAALFLVVSCGSDSEEANPKDEVTEKTEKELDKVQEDNVELEEIDGELDSILNEIQ